MVRLRNCGTVCVFYFALSFGVCMQKQTKNLPFWHFNPHFAHFWLFFANFHAQNCQPWNSIWDKIQHSWVSWYKLYWTALNYSVMNCIQTELGKLSHCAMLVPIWEFLNASNESWLGPKPEAWELSGIYKNKFWWDNFLINEDCPKNFIFQHLLSRWVVLGSLTTITLQEHLLTIFCLLFLTCKQ